MDIAHDPLAFRLTVADVAPGSSVVSIAGELDLTQAAHIDAVFEDLLETGVRHVIVDLLEVPFLDSTVLGILVRHVERLRADDGEMTIVTDDMRVTRVFEITGLASRFRFERSLSDAIERVLGQLVA